MYAMPGQFNGVCFIEFTWLIINSYLANIQFRPSNIGFW
jgi:hypothetical protein